MPRLIGEGETADGVTGVGETYGDTKYLEPARPFVLTERLVFEGGRVAGTDAPGLGVELDRERLRTLHQRWPDDEGTLRDRDDAAAMRAAEPGWTTPTVPRW